MTAYEMSRASEHELRTRLVELDRLLAEGPNGSIGSQEEQTDALWEVEAIWQEISDRSLTKPVWGPVTVTHA